MAKFCRQCGKPLTPGARFCRECGWKVTDSTDTPPKKTETAPTNPTTAYTGTSRGTPSDQNLFGQAPHQQQIPPSQQNNTVPATNSATAETDPTTNCSSGLFSLNNMGLFLLLGVFLFNAGPSLFCAVKMTLQQAFLSDFQVRVLDLMSKGIGSLFVAAAFLCMSSSQVPLLKRIVRTLLGCTPIYFALSLSMFFAIWFVSSWAVIPAFILSFLMSLITVAAIFSAAADAATMKERGLFKNVFLLIRHPLKYLLWLVIFWLISVVQMAVTYGLLLITKRETLTADYVSWLILSAAETLIFYFILVSMRTSAIKWLSKTPISGYNMNSPIPGYSAVPTGRMLANGLISFNFAIIALALTGAGLILSLIRPGVPKTDWSHEVDTEIASDLAMSNYTLVAGSIPDAIVYADRVSEKIDLLSAYSRKDRYTLLTSAQKSGTIRTWCMFLALAGDDESACKDAVGKLEDAVIASPMNLDLKGLLLSCYEKGMAGEMGPLQKDFRKEIVREYILDGVYTYVFPQIPENNEDFNKYIEELKANTAFLAEYRNSLSVLDQISGKGKLEGGDIDKIIKWAEDHPDNVGLQYAAAYAASEGASDDTRYLFDRGKERILSFLELVEKNEDPEALRNARLLGAEMLIKVRGYREATDILTKIDIKEVPELGTTVTALKLTAFNGLDDPEEAYSFAKVLLEEGNETPELLYKFGVAAIKAGKRDEMIRALERLSSYMLDENITGDELYQIENRFYVLCTYITSNDGSTYTGYTYAFYGSLSEEERETMFSPFVHHYLEAMDQGYHRDPKIAEEELAKVLAARSDLTYATYLGGVIAFAARDYEKAVQYYTAACAADPESATFLFGLANAYDGTGDYRKAYDLCVRVQSMIPKVNHDEDWYGIGYHNTQLMNKLADKLKED